MVDWAAARAQLEDICSDVFDQTLCHIQPRKAGLTGNHKAVDDYSREAFDFLGTVDLHASLTESGRNKPADPETRGAVMYDAVLTAHVGGWPYQPQRGDFIIAGGVTYKIEAKERDGSSRPAWYLNRA